MAENVLSRVKSLLIPTDGSEYSEGALREGIRLAKGTGAKVTALFVIEFNPEFEALAPNLIEKEEQSAQARLKAVKDMAEKEGVPCTALMVRSDKPYEAIIEEAGKAGADLIVMGRRGRTGIKKLLMGSVTAKVIGHSKTHVLVVPKAASVALKNIVAATDGSICAKEAVAAAASIAKANNSALTIVSVVPSENVSALDIVHSEMHRSMISDAEVGHAEKNIAGAKEIASAEGVKADGIIAGGKPYEIIVETAKEKRADLIVIGCKGKGGLQRALMGSVTERVVGLAACATLVVVEQK